MNRYAAVIIGGGHNGLIAATCVAPAGRNVLVVKSERVGSATINEKILPGFTVTRVLLRVQPAAAADHR